MHQFLFEFVDLTELLFPAVLWVLSPTALWVATGLVSRYELDDRLQSYGDEKFRFDYAQGTPS